MSQECRPKSADLGGGGLLLRALSWASRAFRAASRDSVEVAPPEAVLSLTDAGCGCGCTAACESGWGGDSHVGCSAGWDADCGTNGCVGTCGPDWLYS